MRLISRDLPHRGIIGVELEGCGWTVKLKAESRVEIVGLIEGGSRGGNLEKIMGSFIFGVKDFKSFSSAFSRV
jgi:hypothetical protein